MAGCESLMFNNRCTNAPAPVPLCAGREPGDLSRSAADGSPNEEGPASQDTAMQGLK
ncbi:hypothetical protein LA76x_3037 [Lysobacter antibioticus]|uniref:Uncharacterized protein n=1 Tax=Lysobacter antibioticus TaxID=84531 RepID=A0A0S2FCJ4_LYSAN|nr:hypothetical protein LA76x_3037 [Lysobacter antibioticus]